MNNGGSSFLIFCLGDPHGLEGREGTKDRSSDPDKELSLGGSNYLDFHGRWGKSSHLLAKTLGDARVHSCATGHDNVAIKVLADIDIALQDGLVTDFVESWHFLTDHHGLEEGLRASEPLRGYSDNLSIRQFVGFVVLSGIIVGLIASEFTLCFSFVVKGNVTEFFLDISDCLRFG